MKRVSLEKCIKWFYRTWKFANSSNFSKTFQHAFFDFRIDSTFYMLKDIIMLSRTHENIYRFVLSYNPSVREKTSLRNTGFRSHPNRTILYEFTFPSQLFSPLIIKLLPLLFIIRGNILKNVVPLHTLFIHSVTGLSQREMNDCIFHQETGRLNKKINLKAI